MQAELLARLVNGRRSTKRVQAQLDAPRLSPSRQRTQRAFDALVERFYLQSRLKTVNSLQRWQQSWERYVARCCKSGSADEDAMYGLLSMVMRLTGGGAMYLRVQPENKTDDAVNEDSGPSRGGARELPLVPSVLQLPTPPPASRTDKVWVGEPLDSTGVWYSDDDSDSEPVGHTAESSDGSRAGEPRANAVGMGRTTSRRTMDGERAGPVLGSGDVARSDEAHHREGPLLPSSAQSLGSTDGSGYGRSARSGPVTERKLVHQTRWCLPCGRRHAVHGVVDALLGVAGPPLSRPAYRRLARTAELAREAAQRCPPLRQVYREWVEAPLVRMRAEPNPTFPWLESHLRVIRATLGVVARLGRWVGRPTRLLEQCFAKQHVPCEWQARVYRRVFSVLFAGFTWQAQGVELPVFLEPLRGQLEEGRECLRVLRQCHVLKDEELSLPEARKRVAALCRRELGTALSAIQSVLCLTAAPTAHTLATRLGRLIQRSRHSALQHPLNALAPPWMRFVRVDRRDVTHGAQLSQIAFQCDEPLRSIMPQCCVEVWTRIWRQRTRAMLASWALSQLYTDHRRAAHRSLWSRRVLLVASEVDALLSRLRHRFTVELATLQAIPAEDDDGCVTPAQFHAHLHSQLQRVAVRVVLEWPTHQVWSHTLTTVFRVVHAARNGDQHGLARGFAAYRAAVQGLVRMLVKLTSSFGYYPHLVALLQDVDPSGFYRAESAKT